MIPRIFLLFIIACTTLATDKLPVMYEWKEVDFAFPSIELQNRFADEKTYIRDHNLPLGLDRWNNKLFITVPRWKSGVPASLTYIDLKEKSKNPVLHPYPSLEANTLPADRRNTSNVTIISVFRVRVDKCDRLWVMDTGLANILDSPSVYSKPSILIFDLKTDQLIRRYELKETDKKEDSFFANIVVDVPKGECANAYAYIPDLGGYGVVVYSFAENDSWRVKHHYFYFDPIQGNYTIGGVNFQWSDGVFSIALSPENESGYRTVYFHALSSTKEFAVSSKIWRNKTIAVDPHTYNEYKLVGDRGENTQATASFLDEKTGILFYTQVNRNGIACWNSNKPFVPENLHLIASDNTTLIFPNDLKVDREGNLWVLSDRMPEFIFKELNSNDVNYRIFKAPVKELTAGTPCDLNYLSASSSSIIKKTYYAIYILCIFIIISIK